ncbi:hypothetical protein AGABI2DRAFT_181699 [Agaricus bisporus var. bisporus H97]|uniref:hypothetical protein n=1 Tax=Agaricus bisporus var. bisporus (strain H97 / ATCC MYA-4626 / FGSC 10389) TaxID=936046 RepID=UPI00029F7A6C|nr:hypothetical protein AGABI2DRAFT_181699 [Agaricus bisporus var. bisporus H97]EKV41909.1 hypothetical protein AGABI2DRAFT_181699 [Agaricus bisporus var. bisporus H97]
MSDTLFSRTPRRGSTPHHARFASNEREEGSFYYPSASVEPPEGWVCDEPYKYSIKSSKYPLEMCNEVVERHDEKAGLFLAIVATFTVDSYKSLQEDKQDTMSDLLIEVVRLLNDTSVQGKATLPKSFVPNHHAIVVNQLWFLSMILSLIAVAMGTFCLQWISAFSRGSDLTEKSVPPHKSLAMRQLRYEGVVGWGVLHAPEVLLLLVQLSIGLFTCGLVYFLWNVHDTTTIPALVAAGFAGALLYLMNLLPFVQPLVGAFIPVTLTVPQCPYKSPTSWLIQSAGNLLPYILKLFLDLSRRDWVGAVGRPGIWLKSLPLPFTDFLWKQHDFISAKSRDIRQDQRRVVGARLYYFGLGLSSALDHLIYEPDANEIVSSCLQHLQPLFATAGDWEMFSHENLSDVEKSFLDNEYRLVSHLLPRRLNNAPLQLEHANRIRIDFLNALILQYLTRSNAKLARMLFRHRVELYIRVKNSTEFIVRGDESDFEFGKSLQCPLQGFKDIGELDLGDAVSFSPGEIGRSTDLDIMNAAAIVRIESADITTSPTNIQNVSETRRSEGHAEDEDSDAPAEEERLGAIAQEERSDVNADKGRLGAIAEKGGSDSIAEEEQETLDTDHRRAEYIDIRKFSHRVPSTRTGAAFSTRIDPVRTRSHWEENPWTKVSLTSLCYQVRQQLSQLLPSAFEDINSYRKLRMSFGLPVEINSPEPKNPRTGDEVV